MVTVIAVHSGSEPWCIIQVMKKLYFSLLFSYVLCLLVFLFVLPLSLSAQTLGGQDALVVSLSPERPGAEQIVSVDVESYAVDIQSAVIGYTINGVLKKRGVGEKHFLFQTGKAGSVTTLTVIAQMPDGRILSKEFKIRPADVLLLWQSSSYTPPFYKGKALFPFQGSVTVAAIPLFVNAEGKRLAERELVYTWEEDGKVIGDSSGFGKSLFVFQGAVPMREKTVSVEVETIDHALLAAAEITIPPVAPHILLYENHPLFGIRFEQALTRELVLNGDEVRLSAIPFFFEAADRGTAALRYDWKLNYQTLSSETRSDIVLRRNSGDGGTAFIGLTAQHTTKTFQADDASLSVSFKEREFSSLPDSAPESTR
ncbi:MAG: hypothetical protein Q7R88_01230 [bacterium]|nr:hypothetical protein [bacterium]